LALVAGLIAYFISRVTSALRQREREAGEFADRLARNEQLAALATLAAGAAHELGTPLGTIAVIAKELEIHAAGTAANEPLAEDARLIRREVDRCRTILERMRVDLAEDASFKASPLPLERFIERLREDLAEGERGRLEVNCSTPPGQTVAPVAALRRAVGVLIRNALDVSPPSEPVRLSVVAEGGRLRFAVQDRGAGMTPEVLRRAGEPFFTTKPPGAGMGLGLFLVRLVARKYGGEFRLESRPGEGTRGVLELPDAAEVKAV